MRSPAVDIEMRPLMVRARRRHRHEQAGCRRARCLRIELAPDALEPRRLLTTFLVNSAADSGAGSLRAAIIAANADPSPDTADIVFAIPASTAPDLTVAAPGFDPSTQTWKITLASPFPVITRTVAIDGYTQRNAPF